MIPDLDIYRSAQLLVKILDQDAPIHAAMRADAMLDKGDSNGCAVWKQWGCSPSVRETPWKMPY